MATRSTAAQTDDHVLVVEDDAAQRVGLEQLLKSWGFSVDTARDGEDALQRVESLRPTIILSDLVMPRRSGLDLLRGVRQNHDDDITMVIMTGQGTVETAVEAIKQGAYDYLTKPVDPQRLKILLDQIVERHDTLREVRALRRQLRERGTFGKMIGESLAMRRDLPDRRAGGADERVGAGERRIRHGQGGRGADHPPAQPPRGPAVRAAQLRGHPRHAARERAVRPREGRVHRRRRAPPGLLRAGQPRHAVLRRDRRDDPGHAGQAAARPAGALVPAARRPARAVGRRARRSRPRTSTRPKPSARTSCARTSTTGSTSLPSGCRRCATARTTCRCSSTRSWPSSTSATSGP